MNIYIRCALFSSLIFLIASCGGDEVPLTGAPPMTQLEVPVMANKAWQDTGVIVQPNSRTIVEYLNGRWSVNSMSGFVDAMGLPIVIAKPRYALPGSPEGALIGKVGSSKFLIGKQVIIPEGLHGKLELIINDDIDGLYGMGLADNVGSINVLISSY